MGGGAFDVLMLQNLHPRVHVSPISMMVAVAVPLSPPQHSPTFGHLASSHTVLSPRPCRDCFTLWNCLSFTIDLSLLKLPSALTWSGLSCPSTLRCISSSLLTSISLPPPSTNESKFVPSTTSCSLSALRRLPAAIGGASPPWPTTSCIAGWDMARGLACCCEGRGVCTPRRSREARGLIALETDAILEAEEETETTRVRSP
mmetsp:Transcript_44583/g.107586  ORF Transcript_44583/g.107586 Transcript_44583/m.107586 type:complete len:202 (+) Transcript_44583:737-1342(+)